MNLDLTPIAEFYNKQKTGVCIYKEKRGAMMGLKCTTPTDDISTAERSRMGLFCPKHQKYNPNLEKATKFLELLCKNPEMIDNILDAGLYAVSRHSPEQCEDDEEDDCNFCDSDEEEADSILAETVKDAMEILLGRERSKKKITDPEDDFDQTK